MAVDRSQHRLRKPLVLATIAAVAAGLIVTGAAAPAAGAVTVDALGVDLSLPTGAFRGGANGTLYGLSDNGVPSQAVLDGAHVTNSSQKPPDGAQHPNGDALKVESSFFAGAGKDMYVYIQDEYPDWAYNGGKRPGDANNDGVWDYVPIIRAAVEKVDTTSAHPQDYVFIPFNEPDGGNWYANWSTMKDQFLADWSTAYATIEDVYAAHGLGHARIGGPGDSRWQPTRSTDFLTYAGAHAQLPDVFIWHELGTNNTATFRGHYGQYRAVLSSLGLPSIPVNITEYGLLRDMGVPGQLIQWLSMFEDEKVDAQTAYWNYAGNLDDNSSRYNGGNGGWWMLKWYGDLSGSQTVKVTPPQLNVADTLQGIGAIDTADKKATVLFGGESNDVKLNVTGLSSATFGQSVDIQVRANRLNGAEGASLEPPVILSVRAKIQNGSVSITVPNSDRYSAYKVEVTPPLAARQPVANDLVNSTEAENATLTNASTYYQNPSQGFTFMASNSHDVGSFNQPGSSASWNVTVPHTGTYRLSALAGANGTPGEHALFVDGSLNQVIRYSADLGWSYRGTTDVTIPLTAGTHSLSIRASKDGTTMLPGADITLDRFDLYDATDGENATYRATDARLAGGAHLRFSDRASAGYADLSASGRATFFAAAEDTGYYDVTAHYRTTNASTVRIQVNGRTVAMPAAPAAGPWDSTARVFLAQGINEIDVSSSTGALLGNITTSRRAKQRAADADTANVYRAEAESLTLSGTAVVQTIPADVGSNGSADSSGVVREVGYIGNGSGNTITLTRPASFGVGNYVLVVGAANAERNSGINYNPQVVSRFLDVTEAGGGTTRGAFRHNYSWNSFWDKSIPLTLTTASGSLTLGNAAAYAPDIDTIALARFVTGTPATVESQ